MLVGRDGDDYFFTSPGRDRYIGGKGRDRVVHGAHDAGQVPGSPTALRRPAERDFLFGIEKVVGSRGDSGLVGTAAGS